MKKVDTTRLSHDECWGVQINGTNHCKHCKWTGISACEGKDIVSTGRNHLGYRIGEEGLIASDWQPVEVHSSWFRVAGGFGQNESKN